MACQTQYLLFGHYDLFSPTALFLFFGTLLIYSLHRLYGLRKADPTTDHPYRPLASLLWINTGISGIGTAVCWLQLSAGARWQTLAPCVLSLAYILPLLPGGRRLRDVAFLKVFLITFCWSWLTVVLPAVQGGMGWSAVAMLMAIERAAFIFAIGIGFDLRDRVRDREAGVTTLPILLGERGAIVCAAIGLFIAAGLAWLLAKADIYPSAAFYSIAGSGLAVLWLVTRSGKENRNPWYFVFGLDGLMILQFLLVLL